jgi:hypothetical protein
VLTNATQEGSPGFMSCNTPEGFKGGNFGSVIELFSEQDSCPPAHVAGHGRAAVGAFGGR